MAERYLSRVFPDADRPHFLSYPLIKGRGVEADPAFAELWQRHVDSRRLAMPTPA